MSTQTLAMQTPTAAPAARPESELIIFENVSKFYGDVLGVNRVSLNIAPGVTSLVGPNGAGKTTLMNLLTGLIWPTRGRIRVLGTSPADPEKFFRLVGYCTQFDSFAKGITGYEFIFDTLRLHGLSAAEARRRTEDTLDRVNMTEASRRKVAGYSKGMRQRIRLGQALAHHPRVLVLDEPLNGLDPMARAECMALFQSLGREGMHVVISSHILHEVDRISDQVVFIQSGYVVAEGNVHGVRDEVTDQPVQILVRSPEPNRLAAKLFTQDHVTEAKITDDRRGVLIRTRDSNRFYDLLNRMVVEEGLEVEAVTPADDDVNSVYQYLIGSEGASI
jgi:ABC-2 type transport system ATP-binding protein